MAEGGSVVINGRDVAKSEQAAHQIDASNKRVLVRTGDVALPATGEALVKASSLLQARVRFKNEGRRVLSVSRSGIVGRPQEKRC